MKALIATVFLALAPAAALAQGPVANDTAFGDWRVACRAVTTDQTECRLVQTVTRTSDKSLVVRLIAVPRTDTGVVLVAQMPMGVFLGARPAMRLEGSPEGSEISFAWQRCVKDICEAAVPLTDAQLADMMKAGKVLFGYKAKPADKPLVVRLNVAQLDTGLAAIAPKKSAN